MSAEERRSRWRERKRRLLADPEWRAKRNRRRRERYAEDAEHRKQVLSYNRTKRVEARAGKPDARLKLDPSSPVKTCWRCRETKPKSEFGVSQRSRDGRQSGCKECGKEMARERHLRNPELRRAQWASWYERNRETKLANDSAYWKAHPEKSSELCARRRARILATQVEPVDYRRVLELHGRVCHLCGDAIGDDLHFDHVIPLARGGEHSYENVRPAHAGCNHRKHAKLVA